jgi:hypothetical protein
MKAKGMFALGAASIALLVGPGTAWAQDDGTPDPAAPVTTGQADPTVAPSQDPATTPGSEDTSTATDTPSDSGLGAAADGDSSAQATAEPTADTPVDSASADTVDSQPQAEVESATKTETVSTTTTVNQGAVKKGSSCGLSAASAHIPRGVGPPGPGCTRVDGSQISSDPANPTVLPPINGVTVAIWIVNTPNGPEVHWQIVNGTFNGTDAIDLSVKGGPDPNGFTCQITNATPTGICHPPVNPNNGKFYGVSHVEACPGSTTSPPVNLPPGTSPPGTTPGGGAGGVAGQVGQGGAGGGNKGGNQKGVSGAPAAGGNAPTVAAATVAAPSGQLPVTGAEVLWLILSAIGLLGVGAAMRTRLN